MEVFENCYFKDFGGDHPGFISGLMLPRDADGVTRNKKFVNCNFHAGMDQTRTRFENCEFVDCEIPRLG